MGIIRISIFQKSLPEGLNLGTLKKLASVKSDFLLLPEYFFADSTLKDHREALEKSQHAVDWLLKLNESYKGIIIGGSVIRKEGDRYFNASPIISDGLVVDWYRKRNLMEREQALMSPGTETGIFILGGQRFAVLICADVLKPEYFEELHQAGIKLVFTVMNSPYREETPEVKHARDEELFLKPARKYGMYIAKCCSAGSIFGHRVQGRSLVATPTGISWRVAPQEEDQEILKTVMIHVV